MRTIHGVLGPIKPEDLGSTLMHEHITMADWSMRANFGTKVFDEQKVLPHAVKHVKRAKDAGIKTIVEATAINSGRDVPFIRKVAEESGVNIIASTGLFHDHSPWLVGRDFTDVYELLCDECKNGMAGTNSLPGIVKAAVADEGVDFFIARLLDMLGRVAATNELSIAIHHVVGTKAGPKIIEVLKNAGVKPHHILLLHAGDSNDLEYLKDMLSEGVYIGNDRFGYQAGINSIENRVNTTVKLAEMGYLDRVVLSHDLGAYLAFYEGQDPAIARDLLWEDGIGFGFNPKGTPYECGGSDFALISNHVVPLMKSAGLTQNDIDQMLIRNPLALLAND